MDDELRAGRAELLRIASTGSIVEMLALPELLLTYALGVVTWIRETWPARVPGWGWPRIGGGLKGRLICWPSTTAWQICRALLSSNSELSWTP